MGGLRQGSVMDEPFLASATCNSSHDTPPGWGLRKVIIEPRARSSAWGAAGGDGFREHAERLGAGDGAYQLAFFPRVDHGHVALLAREQDRQRIEQLLVWRQARWRRPHHVERNHAVQFLA